MYCRAKSNLHVECGAVGKRLKELLEEAIQVDGTRRILTRRVLDCGQQRVRRAAAGAALRLRAPAADLLDQCRQSVAGRRTAGKERQHGTAATAGASTATRAAAERLLAGRIAGRRLQGREQGVGGRGLIAVAIAVRIAPACCAPTANAAGGMMMVVAAVMAADLLRVEAIGLDARLRRPI